MLCLGLLAAADRLREKQQKEEQPEENASDPRTAYILQQIEARRAAKAARNYAEADAIRNALAAEGITLIDTPQGTKFRIGE